jgi:hypothetical protein
MGQSSTVQLLTYQLLTKYRPKSVQTAKQEEFVLSFQHYLRELQVVFAIPKQHSRFTFDKAMRRQARYLHGLEGQSLRFVPKIVHVILQRVQELHRIRNDAPELAPRRRESNVDMVWRTAEMKGYKDKIVTLKVIFRCRFQC